MFRAQFKEENKLNHPSFKGVSKVDVPSVLGLEKFRKYEHMTFDELCQLDSETLVARVGKIDFTVGDLSRLKPPRFLNGEIIAGYIQKTVCNQNSDTICLPLLNQNLASQPVNRVLTRQGEKLKKLNKQIIIVPIETSSHWTVAIIHLGGKTIHYFDSLFYKLKPSPILYKLREFAERLFDTKLKTHFHEDIPKQHNNYDCGVFLVKYVEHFLTEIPMSFTESDMPRFRAEIADLIRKLPPVPEIDYRNVTDEVDPVETEIFDDDLMEDDGKSAGQSCNSLCQSFQRSDLTRDTRTGFFSFEESLELIKESQEPFIGKNESGEEITYNTNGDWKEMLSFTEVLCFLSPNDPKSGMGKLKEEIQKDCSLAIKWNKKSRKPGEVVTPYHFRWCTRGRFSTVRSWMSKFHGVLLEDNYKTQISLDRKAKFAKKLQSR